MEMPSSMLLAIFATCPFPLPPAWKMFLPIASRIGLAFAKASSGPPAMKVSVPASAAAVPPETGASTIRKPPASACFAASRASSTAMVEQSMNSMPGFAFAATPSSPK